MPNIKSAEKRVELSRKSNLKNRAKKSEISTYTKKFKKAIAEKNIEEAEKLYTKVSSVMDAAAQDNIIHKNSASRKKAHFAKMLSDAKKA